MADEDPPSLTTVFTPPAACASALFTLDTDHSSTPLIWRDLEISDEATLTCLPPSYKEGYYTHGRHSPGICPSDMTTISTSTFWDMTYALCCQSDFSLSGENCLSSYSTSTSALLAGQATTTIVGPGIAVARQFVVAWREQDLSLFPPATPSSPKTTTSASVSTATMPTSTHVPSDLSMHRVANIVAGVSVQLIFIALIAACLFIFRRQRQREETGVDKVIMPFKQRLARS